MLRALKLIALLILLPAALACVGWWEGQRLAEEQAYQESAEAQAYIAELKDLHRRALAHDKSAVVEVNGRTYVELAAAALLESEISRLTGADVLTGPYKNVIRRHASRVAWVSGLLGLVIGSGGLLMALWAGHRARRSREHLLQAFSLCQRAFPFLLLGVLLLITLAIGGITVVEGWTFIEHFYYQEVSRSQAKSEVMLLSLGIGGVAAGVLALYSLRHAFAAFSPKPMHLLGQAVNPAEAPALWDHVRHLATRLQARPPQNIVVGLTQGFFVTACDIVLEPRQQRIQGETLFVPLHWAVLLRPDEVDAIVGHELAHFSGADTAYSSRFVPLYAGMGLSMSLLQSSGQGITAVPARMLANS